MKLISLSFIIISSLVWSLLLFNLWSWDYGFYYNTAVNLSDTYRLYSEVFENKGPTYHFFINIISKVIGIGIIQSYATLSITVFIFLFSIYFVSIKKKNNNIFLILFLCLALFHHQNINVSIQLFNSALQIFSFYYLIEFIKKGNSKLYLISIIFFSLAVLTRIDCAIYILIYIYVILLKYKISFQTIKFSVVSIIIFSTIFIIFCFYFSFNIIDFYNHNINFNKNFSNAFQREPFIKIFNSPAHIYVILSTGIGFIFIDLLNKVFNKRISSKKDLVEKNNYDLLTSLLIVCLGLFVWLWSGSDKYYHVFIIYTPLIFFITYFFNEYKPGFIKLFFFYLVTIFFTIINIYPEQKNSIVNNCIFNIQPCGPIKDISKTINDIKKHTNPIIIGDTGWIYLISNTKPKYAIGNSTPYFKQITRSGKIIESFDTKYLKKINENILSQEIGYIFWIEKWLVELDTDNKYQLPSEQLLKILSISEVIEDQGSYMKMQIIKKNVSK